MRRALSILLLLAAASAFAESIVIMEEDPCVAEPPENVYDKPLCADYELHSALIDSIERGDASALALLERRYWVTEPYRERHRLAGVLLGRLANDRAIWNDVFADAQLAVRFADDAEGFERWCEERDHYWLLHAALLDDALSVVASDPRSRALLVQALAVQDRDVAFTAIAGLATQRDLPSLAAIDATLARYPEDARYMALVLEEFHDQRADAIAEKYAVAEEPGEDEEEEEQYTRRMRSRVADELRRELTADVLRMSIDERLELAFRLGDEAVADYARANGVDEETARSILMRQRHAGRRRSKCHEELDD